MQHRQTTAFVLVVISLLYPMNAQSYQAWSDRAQIMRSTFTCAALAGRIGYTEEQAHLFQLGYENGTALVLAVLAGEITYSDYPDAYSSVAVYLDGPNIEPNVDFILGRIYQHQSDSVLNAAALPTAEASAMRSQEEYRRMFLARARHLYLTNNCRLIGQLSPN